MHHRPAHTLIEMLTVITVGSVMTGIAVGILYTLLRADGESRARAGEIISLGRLAEQFRKDVHEASDWSGAGESISQKAEAAGVKLRCEGGREIEYLAEPGQLRRIETAGNQVVGQESYRLPTASVATIEGLGHQRPVVLQLRIGADEKTLPKPALKPRLIEAVLGANHRFEGGETP